MRLRILCAASTLIVAFAAGCGSTDRPRTTPATSASIPSGTSRPANTATLVPYQGEYVDPAPNFRPAESDEWGPWQVIEIHGASVEIPFSTRFRIQVVGDPCHGDFRKFLLVEDLQTGDRLRVDIFPPAVTVTSADPSRLATMRDRILKSAKGTLQPPPFVLAIGPLPTETWCPTPGGNTVPTLTPD